MKRTWYVKVEQGIGHEYHNTTSETDFYGPYTQEEAERLEAKLNDWFRLESGERRKATAMPLERMTPKQLIDKYADEVKEMLNRE